MGKFIGWNSWRSGTVLAQWKSAGVSRLSYDLREPRFGLHFRVWLSASKGEFQEGAGNRRRPVNPKIIGSTEARDELNKLLAKIDAGALS